MLQQVTPTENLIVRLWAHGQSKDPNSLIGARWKVVAEKLHTMSANFEEPTRGDILTLRNVATQRAANP